MQSIGMRDVRVDEEHVQLEPGDRVLLCTDGLTAMVDDATVRDLLGADSVAGAAWAMIDAANAAGGYDNTTVAVVDVRP
jgi:protein phosphatase